MTGSTEQSTASSIAGWQFDNTYTRLPEVLFAPARPAVVKAPKVSILNHALAEQLGLDFRTLSSEAAAKLFTGQDLPAGSLPIAQAYCGHQYGGFTMLGDGRAILLGEHRTPAGRLVDIQFKGSGPTRYSRNGDGRAALGPMLREYIISEAMAALGIPTTRSLAVATTGEMVHRLMALPGAVLTRVAASHLRVGTFEYLGARRDEVTLRLLVDFAIDRHYPELADVPNKVFEFFRAVMDRQAALIARWQLIGFVHGVMNTDNVAISGETIDYGPCAFMNSYRLGTVFSSIDRNGRYAYGNQPAIGQWNLARFAESLVPILDPDRQQAIALANDALGEHPALFERYWHAGMRKKLGLQTEEADDVELIQALLDWMESTKADFTTTFRTLASPSPPTTGGCHEPEFRAWHARWQLRLSREQEPLTRIHELMRTVNPAVIPRNHRVEEALVAAEERDDLSVLHRLLAALASPFDATPDVEQYLAPPENDGDYRTFCGT
ncbi:MAG: YdiU family protein [Planctomycetota bacterium]|nr:YdiU family protein [Planctomycetota bacterium]